MWLITIAITIRLAIKCISSHRIRGKIGKTGDLREWKVESVKRRKKLIIIINNF